MLTCGKARPTITSVEATLFTGIKLLTVKMKLSVAPAHY